MARRVDAAGRGFGRAVSNSAAIPRSVQDHGSTRDVAAATNRSRQQTEIQALDLDLDPQKGEIPITPEPGREEGRLRHGILPTFLRRARAGRFFRSSHSHTSPRRLDSGPHSPAPWRWRRHRHPAYHGFRSDKPPIRRGVTSSHDLIHPKGPQPAGDAELQTGRRI